MLRAMKRRRLSRTNRRALALLLVAHAGVAHAQQNEESTTEPPLYTLVAPHPLSPVALRLDEEQVTLTCTDPAPEPCDLEALWVISNPSPQPVEVSFAVELQGSEYRVAVGSERPRHDVEGQQVVEASIGPLEKLELRVRASLPMTASATDVIPAVRARHLYVGVDIRRFPPGAIRFVPAAPGEWMQVPRYELALVTDGRWEHPTWPLEADRYVFRGTTRTQPVLLAPRPARRSAFVHGGPILAYGYSLERGNHFRFGYEVGLGSFVLFQLAFGFDRVEHAFITPTLLAALPMFGFAPGLAFGVGVPFSVREEKRTGIRLLADVYWGALGVDVAFDLYPAQESLDITISGHLSF